MRELPTSVLERARGAHGVVVAAELAADGWDRSAVFRAVRAGLLQRVAPATYAVAALADPFTRVAALQRRQPALILDRRAAAAAWGFDGFRPAAGRTVPLDLARADGVRCRTVGARRIAVGAADVGEVAGLRVTTPARTLADLCGMAGVGADALELALESALRGGGTSYAELRRQVEAGGAARRALGDALARRRPDAPATDSYAETRFLQEVVRPLGIEDPDRQVPIFIPGRPEPYRADFLFRRPLGCLDVEIDGVAFHGPQSGRDDAVRDHFLRTAGVQTLRLDADRVDQRPNAARSALARELKLLDR